MYSGLSLYNKLLLYKKVLKPVWVYGVQPVSYTHLDVYKRQEKERGSEEFAASARAGPSAL